MSLRLRISAAILLLPLLLTACAGRNAQSPAPEPLPPNEAEQVPDADAQKFLKELKPPPAPGVAQAGAEVELEVPALPAAYESESGELSLAKFEQMALDSNPTLQQMAAVVEKTRGVYDQVGKYPNPIVGYFGQEMGSDGTLGMQGGFVSQTIVTGDKLQRNRDVARALCDCVYR